eukprot:GFUD01103608.1.p1 GENE.GFUD01103608.1~~GFUD01103608.1.p1  ORF type:complete len:181 (-),score=27.35 GFUD01103608.1:529-1071(-)
MTLLLLLLLVTLLDSSSACSCNGLTLPGGRGECRTLYKGRPFCYVNKDDCSDEVQSTTTYLYWSFSACLSKDSSCPLLEPSFDSIATCSSPLSCSYGRECCCGQCGGSKLADCDPSEGAWYISHTDRCFAGCPADVQSNGCKGEYQIYAGEEDCCSSDFAPARCCHTPASEGDEIYEFCS